MCATLDFISQIEPKSFKEPEKDEYWIGAMQEELKFERNECPVQK